MEYIQLGQSDLQVSRICLGCMGFGDPTNGQHHWTLDQTQTKTIIAHALDQGINFFDTAISYQNGTSEMYVGKALNDLIERDKVVVATKFLPHTNQEIKNGITVSQHIEDSLNASLNHLGMDYVDLYIYHMWDYRSDIREILHGLTTQIKKGKIRYIGISNCFAWQLAKANALADQYGYARFVSVQGHYNLIFREEEREMIPYCNSEHIALTPYSALAGGRLSKHPGETSDRLIKDDYAKLKYDATMDIDGPIIARVAELAKHHQCSMSEIALAWLLSKVDAPVVGATKSHHIDGAVKAVDIHLTNKELQYLEELYKPHALVGVMAQNKPETSNEKHVWTKE